jgi:NOL1/NOP2/sun family putative RNA methylase
VTPFERYRPLLADWDAFEAALARPLPTCIWANPLRITPAELAGLLTADGIDFEPLPWHPGGFRLRGAARPGRHWAYLAGLYHVQEEVSMVPVSLLDPQPGERVLDMCAAPGGKTAQIGVMMGNRGTVIANDINAGRMRAVRHTLERLGLVNVTTTVANAASYPRAAGTFDRILVDAPCSCEGTSRKEPGVLTRISPAVSLKKSGLQLALLKKAMQHCRPGGRVVYSTCTYAPEETEMVGNAVLREWGPERVRLLPASLPGLVASPGLTEWAGQVFDRSLRHALRLWPQQNDTGGFFVAVLEKSDEAPALPEIAPVEDDWPPAPPHYLAMVVERFGLTPADLAPYRLTHYGERRAYLLNADHRRIAAPPPDAAGMQFMRTRTNFPKLSTAAAIHLGGGASRNFIDLDEAQFAAYIERREFAVSAGQAGRCDHGATGYVLARYRGFTLGVAMFRQLPGGGGVAESLFPKGWSPYQEASAVDD